MFIPLLKVDAVQRLVYGRIDETPDRAGEIFDYASSKPHFEKWSGDFSTASEGKSAGNLRAMHDKVAAGLFKSVVCDDASKSIELCAHVVDDAEWNKVVSGVYTGFSPGGRYAKRWKDGAHQRYTAVPSEISLVDLPCIPTATFTMVKGDGLEEQVPFQQPTPEDAFTKALAAAASRDHYAQIVVAASADLLEKLFGADGEDVPAETGLQKSLFSASARRQDAATGVAMTDGSFPISAADDLAHAIEGIERAPDPARAKQHIVARAKALGATDRLPAEWAGSTRAEAEIAKVARAGDLAKLAFELAGAREDLAKALGDNEALRKRVAELEAQPTSGGPRRLAIAKGEDVGDPGSRAADQAEALAKIRAMPEGLEKATALTKLAMSGAGV